MRLKLLTLAITLAATSLPSYGEDLLDAYREARAHDPVLSQADATRRATGEGVDQARAQLLPQISAGLSLSQTNASSSGTSTSSTSLNGTTTTSNAYGHTRERDLTGTVSQTVLDLSKIADLQAAHSQAKAQDLTYAAAEQNLYVRVATAYFGVLTAEDALKYAQASEDSYRQAYEQADQQYKVGISAITDMYSAKASYEAAKAATVTAQNTLEDDKEALTQITGQPTGTFKHLREDLPLDPPSPSDPKAWVQTALVYNPTLLSDIASVEAEEHDINAARAGHLPTVTASVDYGKEATWARENGHDYQGRPSTTFGLTLTVPIFSGGNTQSLVRQAIDVRDEAQDAAESERRLVVRDALNYYRSVIAEISEVQSGKAAVDSGQKALDATRAGFSVGTKTMTDVLAAIETLSSSESTYSQNRHQLVLNKLLLKQTAGTIEYKDVEAANALLQ